MTDLQLVYNLLRSGGLSEAGAIAMMGNWQCESVLDPWRMQGDLSADGARSHQYVAQVTSGAISRAKFGRDQIGFGLAQWTYVNPTGTAGRKFNLYDYWKSSGLALDSPAMQTRFAIWELQQCGEYASVYSFLRTVQMDELWTAVDRICRKYEQPYYNNVQARYDAALAIAAQINPDDTSIPDEGEPEPEKPKEPDTASTVYLPKSRQLCRGMCGTDVLALQALLICRSQKPETDGVFGSDTDAAVRAFQKSAGLQADGIAGPLTWSAIGIK